MMSPGLFTLAANSIFQTKNIFINWMICWMCLLVSDAFYFSGCSYASIWLTQIHYSICVISQRMVNYLFFLSGNLEEFIRRPGDGCWLFSLFCVISIVNFFTCSKYIIPQSIQSCKLKRKHSKHAFYTVNAFSWNSAGQSHNIHYLSVHCWFLNSYWNPSLCRQIWNKPKINNLFFHSLFRSNELFSGKLRSVFSCQHHFGWEMIDILLSVTSRYMSSRIASSLQEACNSFGSLWNIQICILVIKQSRHKTQCIYSFCTPYSADVLYIFK